MKATPAARVTMATVGIVATSALFAGCSGSAVSISVPSSGGAPQFSASVPGGGAIQGGSTLPTNWPSDVPTPTAIPLKQAVSIGSGMTAVFSGPGDIQAVQKDLTTRFAQNGFTTSTALGIGGPNGGIAVFEKGNTKVQVVVGNQGGEIAISETVSTDGSTASFSAPPQT